MDRNEVLARLSEHARADVTQFVQLSTSEIQAHPQAWLIKKLKRYRTYKGDDVIDERFEIEVHDPQAALLHIGKHLKLFSDSIINIDGENVKLYAGISPDDWDE